MSVFPQSEARGMRKIDMVEILRSTETVNYIQISAQCCRKYSSHRKKLRIKVVRN